MKSKQTKPNCDWMLGVRAWKFGAVLTFVLLWSCAGPALANANQAPMAAHTTANPSADRAAPIPVDQLGAVAGRQYPGDGLSVSATPEGARLRCVFQRLEGEVTRTGLWLTSTVIPPSGTANDRFRVVATEVGRWTAAGRSAGFQTCRIADFPIGGAGIARRHAGLESCDTAGLEVRATKLPRTGTVSVEGQLVRFARPGLVEEYRVSLDGVRQDFIIEQPPLNPQPSTITTWWCGWP